MSVGVKLEEFDACGPDVHEPSHSLVGHLMWLANQTCLDILNTARAVVRYSDVPKFVYWKAALHVLMDVRFTSSYCITFQRGTECGVNMEVYVDSDYASKAEDRRSVSGSVVMCAGVCVSFFSGIQNSITLSSTEAEYVAMVDGWIKGIGFLAVSLEYNLSG